MITDKKIEDMREWYEQSADVFMTEARMIARECWQDDETRTIEMDVRLSEAFARRLFEWIDIAAQHAQNEEFYRDLLVQCGKLLGPEVYVSDDGSIQDEPLLLKIPEVLARHLRRRLLPLTATTPPPAPAAGSEPQGRSE